MNSKTIRQTFFATTLACLLYVCALLSGCTSVPLVEESVIPIDRELLGGWDLTMYSPVENKYGYASTAIFEQLSKTEYQVEYIGDDGVEQQLRAYLIDFDGQRYLQVQDSTEDAATYYTLLYEFTDNKLLLSLLVLPNECDSTQALQQQLRKQLYEPQEKFPDSRSDN